ncbi:hypothetical protein AGLY_009823 [Aphis glycines]|uniref:Uncharacterized protein n=1 Tax=Aphis glycines TaxID=307491 RepID=A0A6G0TJ52_APHGL|nr:hypothetical protein AGLY_009823 [Aphis glycines]
MLLQETCLSFDINGILKKHINRKLVIKSIKCFCTIISKFHGNRCVLRVNFMYGLHHTFQMAKNCQKFLFANDLMKLFHLIKNCNDTTLLHYHLTLKYTKLSHSQGLVSCDTIHHNYNIDYHTLLCYFTNHNALKNLFVSLVRLKVKYLVSVIWCPYLKLHIQCLIYKRIIIRVFHSSYQSLLDTFY